MPDKVRVSEELYAQLARIAEGTGRSIKELVEEAIKAYLVGGAGADRPIKSVQSRIITSQFSSRCKVCGSEVPQGSLAYYTRYVYDDGSSRSSIVCLDCYFKDTALAEWYLRKRKLQHIVKGLEKKAEELAKKVEELEVQVGLKMIKREVVELYSEFRRYIFGEERTKLDEIASRLDVVEERLRELEDYLKAVRRGTAVVRAR